MKERKVLHSDAMGTLVRETWHPDSGESVRDIFRECFASGPATLQEAFSDLRAYVDAGLAGDDWPRSNTRVAYSRDEIQHWRHIDSFDDAQPDEQPIWSEFYVECAAEPLSRAWYLARIAVSLRFISGANRREIDQFHHGMKIGTYLEAIELRRRALPWAESGQKYDCNSRIGRQLWSGQSFANTKGHEAQEYANRLYSEKPTRTWSQIRKLVAAQYGVSPETIKKVLTNPKRKKVG